MHTQIQRALDWLRGREPALFVALFVLIATTWGFIKIADEVLEGDTLAFDKWMVRSLRQADELGTPIGPDWVQEMGRDATAFGGIAALTFFTCVVAGYLWIIRKHRLVWFLLASTLGGLVISFALKSAFARPRPDIVPHLSIVHTSSFPSGHSMLSAVVYLTLGTLLATALPRMSLKIYVLAVAVTLTGIVGVSRVYLGVHYPTDVMAGWMAGLGWAILCWLVARALQRRHHVEDDVTTSETLDVQSEPFSS